MIQGAVARRMGALLLGVGPMGLCMGGRTGRLQGEAARTGRGNAAYAHGALAQQGTRNAADQRVAGTLAACLR